MTVGNSMRRINYEHILKLHIKGMFEDYSLTVDDAEANDWEIFQEKL